MEPTSVATHLSEPVARALHAIQEALGSTVAFDPATSTRSFRVHMSDMGEIVYLPPLCRLLRSLAPNIRLKVEPVSGSEMNDALRSGRVDFAIGNLPFLTATTRSELLFRESYICMMAKRRGRPVGRKLSTEEFLAFCHARIISADNSHQILENSCLRFGVERKVALDVPHFSALPEILMQTDLVATLPHGVARWFNQNKEFAIYELPFVAPTTDITLHWHSNFESDAGNRWLRQLIVKAVRKFSRGLSPRVR
jgi:DNA-binding transcriptional LysR family regulator